MARIPQLISRREITTQAPAVMKQDQKVGVMGDVNITNQAGQQAAEAITKLGEQMIKVENFNAKSKAKIETTSAMLAYEKEVDENPDLDHALDKADNVLRTIGDNASKNFKNREAREEFMREWELTSLIFKNELQTKIMKRQVDLGRVNTLKEMDLELSNYINAPTDKEKLDSRNKIEAIMAKAVNLGLFSHEQGYGEVEKIIKSGDSIIKDHKQLAKRREKEIALAKKEAINLREQELIETRVKMKDKGGTPISMGELIKMARSDMDRGDIRPKFAEIFINSCKSIGGAGLKSKPNTLKKLADYIINPENKPETIRIEILKENAISSISDEDMDILNTFNENVSKEDVEKQLPKKSFLQKISLWSDEYAGKRDELKAVMFREYMKRVSAGEDPKIVVKEILDKQTELVLTDFNKEFKDRINVRRKSDGKVGTILKEDFNSRIYEEVK